MPRTMTEGEDPHLMLPGTERSDFCEERQRGSSLPDVPVEKGGKQTLPWGVRLKAAKATASTPRFLGLAGIILLAISAGIIVAGIALPNRTQSSPPASSINTSGSGRDGEGVPLDALQPPDPGSLSECTVKLDNWQNYATDAAQAEIQAYGLEVTNATPDILIASLQSLPQLQLSIRYLVLYSPSHPWSRSFQDAATVQTSLLDAAFSGMKITFQLDSVLGIPATDDQVKNCGNPLDESNTSKNGGTTDENCDGEMNSATFISQILQSVNTTDAINVIVCDPDGVNGATNILGGSILVDSGNTNSTTTSNSHSSSDSSTDGTNANNIQDQIDVLDNSIVLRRGALWQSRTSLVHQIGHYLGLPHPFPDSKSCKYDADAIVDTPQQYQSSTSCDTSQPVPLCDQTLVLNVEDYPMYGFMETTIISSSSSSTIGSSTSSIDAGGGGGGCRRHFSPGQVLRARAMLRMLRPELYQAALQSVQYMERIPWAGEAGTSADTTDSTEYPAVNAFQSDLPSGAVVARQLSLYKSAATATAIAVASSTATLDPQQQQQLFPNNEDAVNRLTSALGQAGQAAGGSGGSTSLQDCSCLGPDGSGNVFWTGKLDASYFVDAVRVVQPWETVVNTTLMMAANSLFSSSPSSPSSSSVPPSSSSLPSSDHKGSSSPSPAVEQQLPSPPSRSSPSTDCTGFPVPSIEVRIGNSPNFWENKICGTVNWPGDELVQIIPCQNEDGGGSSSGSISGHFITVRRSNWQKTSTSNTAAATAAAAASASILSGMSSILITAAGAAAAAAARLQAPMCLCDVAALSYTSSPLHPSAVPAGNVPGALLNVTHTTATSSTAALTGNENANLNLSSKLNLLCSNPSNYNSSSSFSSSSGKGGEPYYWSMPLTSTPTVTSTTTTTLTTAALASALDPIWVNGVRFSVSNRCSGLFLLNLLSSNKTSSSSASSSSTATNNNANSNMNNNSGDDSDPENSKEESTTSNSPLISTWQPPLWNTSSLTCGGSSVASNGGGGLFSNVSLDIYVFPSTTGNGAEESNATMNRFIRDRGGEYVCARGVEVAPGQVVDIECDQPLEGHVITFFLAESSGSGTAAAAPGTENGLVQEFNSLIQLCGVQPIGGITLINADIIAAEQQMTVPQSFMPVFTLAVDGNKESCLVDPSLKTLPGNGASSTITSTSDGTGNSTVPSDSSTSTNMTVPADEASYSLLSSNPAATTLWKTGFKGEYLILAVELTTKSAIKSSGISNKEMQLTLFDSAGQEIFNKNISSSSSSATVSTTIERGYTLLRVAINPPVYARTVQIAGFSSLCEISFIAASRTPMAPVVSSSSSGSSVGAGVVGTNIGLSLEHAVAADHTLPLRNDWTVTLPSTSAATPAGAAAIDVALSKAMIDGDPRSCTRIPIPILRNNNVTDNSTAEGEQETPVIVHISLNSEKTGKRFQVPFIQILSNSTGSSSISDGVLVTVSVLDSSSNQEFICGQEVGQGDTAQGQEKSSTDSSGGGGNGGKILKPWQVLGVECPSTAVGDTLVVKLSSATVFPSSLSGGNGSGIEQVVGLCEVWVVGLALVP